MPGKILLFRLGVQIASSIIKKTFDAPASVIMPSLCIIISLQPFDAALFIMRVFANKEVDLISHLPHLISSQSRTLNFLSSKS